MKMLFWQAENKDIFLRENSDEAIQFVKIGTGFNGFAVKLNDYLNERGGKVEVGSDESVETVGICGYERRKYEQSIRNR